MESIIPIRSDTSRFSRGTTSRLLGFQRKIERCRLVTVAGFICLSGQRARLSNTLLSHSFLGAFDRGVLLALRIPSESSCGKGETEKQESKRPYDRQCAALLCSFLPTSLYSPTDCILTFRVSPARIANSTPSVPAFLGRTANIALFGELHVPHSADSSCRLRSRSRLLSLYHPCPGRPTYNPGRNQFSG